MLVRIRAIVLVLLLITPAALALATPPDAGDAAADAAAPVTQTALDLSNATARDAYNATAIPVNESMNKTADLLAQLNATFATVNANLDLLASGSNTTRAFALGTLLATLETANATIGDLRDGAFGFFDVPDDGTVNQTTDTLIGQAKIVALTLNDTIGRLPGTARGQANASGVSNLSTVGNARPIPGDEANATRPTLQDALLGVVASATFARDLALAALRATEPSGAALFGPVRDATGVAIGTIAGVKNNTLNATANQTQQTAFGMALTQIRTATGLLREVNLTLDSAVRVNNTTARRAATDLALGLAQTANATSGSAIDTIDFLGPLTDAANDTRDGSLRALHGALTDLNATLDSTFEAVLGAKDLAVRTVNGTPDIAARDANGDLNTTREDAMGPMFDGLLAQLNMTRLLVLDALEGAAGLVGPQLADMIPNVPETASDNNVPLLMINWPQAGDHNKTPVDVEFTTNLPSNATGPGGFEVSFALPGSGEWTPIATVPCTGAAGTTRTCDLTWDHDLNTPVSIRVGYQNATTCQVGQCARVSGVTLDTIAPTSALNASITIPSHQVVGATDLAFTTEPGATIDVRYSKDGAANVSAGTVVADAAGDAEFSFTPSSAPGSYRLFPRATDRAGNVQPPPGTPVATLHVIDSLSVTGEDELYFVNGDEASVTVCVKVHGEDVDDTGLNWVNGTFDGDDLAFTYDGGCLWSAPLGTISGIATFMKETVAVNATNGTGASALDGAFEIEVTLTPTRLVTIEIVTETLANWVPVDAQATLEVLATYNDTGEPADLLDFVATADGAPVSPDAAGGGFASFYPTSNVVDVVTYVIDADTESSTGNPLPVTTLTATRDITWTRLVTTFSSTQHVANNTNVGSEFAATYKLTWEHSGAPAVGAEFSLTDDDGPVPSGMTGNDGLATAMPRSDVIAAKLYDVSAAYYGDGPAFEQTTDLQLRVNFTRIAVAVSANTTLANIGQTFEFGVVATFLHDSQAVPGATFALRADDNAARVLANVTVGADGIGFADHTFTGIFDDNVSVRLTGSVLGVSAQVTPVAQVARVVSTEVILAPTTANDRDVQPSEAVSFQVAGIYAHNGSNVNGTVTLTPSNGAAVECPVTDGVSECVVVRHSLYSGTFTVSIVTLEGITSIRGGTPATPLVNWTNVTLTLGTPADALVDVGAIIHVPVTATFAHGALPPAAGAAIRARNATGAPLGICTTDGAGACTLALTSAQVYEGIANVDVTSTPQGITQLSAPAATGSLVWTRLLVNYTHDVGPFNKSKPANFHVNVTYEHNGSSAPNALVTILNFSTGTQSATTDANGHALVSAIESSVGRRNLTVVARQPSEGLTANQTIPGLSQTTEQRWTAIGFTAYEYSPAPLRYDANGEPEFATNTAVTVCTKAIEADTNVPISGASITIRGIARTTNGTGDACITIAASSQVRNVTVTAHGVSATIGGKTITASVDRRVVLHFVAS